MTETIKEPTVLITGATGAIATALIAALTARGAKKNLCGGAQPLSIGGIRSAGAAQDGRDQRR